MCADDCNEKLNNSVDIVKFKEHVRKNVDSDYLLSEFL